MTLSIAMQDGDAAHSTTPMAASAKPAGMTSIKLLSEAAAGFQCFIVIAFSGRRTLIKGYKVEKKNSTKKPLH